MISQDILTAAGKNLTASDTQTAAAARDAAIAEFFQALTSLVGKGEKAIDILLEDAETEAIDARRRAHANALRARQPGVGNAR